MGLSIGQCSTASLMIDGKIVACVSEERFTRNKNEVEFPCQAINYCLKQANIKSEELDYVAIGTTHLSLTDQLTKKFSDFSRKDYYRAQYEYWKPTLLEGKSLKWLEVFKDKINKDQYPYNWEGIDYTDEETMRTSFCDLLHNNIASDLKISKSKIIHIDHHTAHAAYAYYASPFRKSDCLVFTIDAEGDGISATISIARNDKLERIAESRTFNLGRLYRYITLILGMTPNEHEYKVMGLAPYAKEYIIQESYNIFKETLYVDGLEFAFKEKPTDMYFYFKERLDGLRFDGIAGGLQRYTEEILVEWVKNTIAHTGISKVVISGGVANNIKALKAIADQDEVSNIFCAPSPGDESLAIGACYVVFGKHLIEQNRSLDQLQPLNNAYLGPDFTDKEVEAFIKKNQLDQKYSIQSDIDPQYIAIALAEGNVVARCSGRGEFGSRALGNRSLIADPRSQNMVAKINEKIKNRDFWMPFTPSMLAERAEDYLQNPKNISAPFMTMAFDSKPLAKTDLPAAIHPYDYTVRPQLVTKEMNEGYYNIIKEFEKITGVGAILNTSLNLHGLPIVSTPEDALLVFENSDIDILILNDKYMLKK